MDVIYGIYTKKHLYRVIRQSGLMNETLADNTIHKDIKKIELT